MPKPKDKKDKHLTKAATVFVEQALAARIFDIDGFEKPEAVADYCMVIAQRLYDDEPEED